jgi:ABC-type antimicrobial peptide transport system permease subunit
MTVNDDDGEIIEGGSRFGIIGNNDIDVYYKDTNVDLDNSVILRLSTVCPSVEFYMEDYIKEYAEEHFEEIKDLIVVDYDNITDWEGYYIYLYQHNFTDDKYNSLSYDEVRTNTINQYLEENDSFNEFDSLTFTNSNLNSDMQYSINVAGFYDDSKEYSIQIDDIVYVTDTFYEHLLDDYGPLLYDYKYVVIPMSDDYQTNYNYISFNDEEFVQDISFKTSDYEYKTYQYSQYNISNEYFASYDQTEAVIESFEDIFLNISLGMMAFVVIFIYYYSSGVIYNKKKELGILRAMGTSKKDILKAFIVEDSILCLIIVALSIVCSIVGVSVTNSLLIQNEYSLLSFINYSFIQVVIIAGITIASIIIGVLIPTINIMRKKPVDIISK